MGYPYIYNTLYNVHCTCFRILVKLKFSFILTLQHIITHQNLNLDYHFQILFIQLQKFGKIKMGYAAT